MDCKLATGTPLTVLEQCQSTSIEAKALLGSDIQLPHWIIARQQKAGYGRRGRGWQMQPGDFAGTLLYPPQVPLSHFAELSFITGLAVLSALESLFSSQRKKHFAECLSLKWPNDVLLNGAKLSGIILELMNPSQKRVLCIGIGVNIVSHPEDTPYPATSLAVTGIKPSIEDMALLIDEHFFLLTSMWQTQGFQPIRQLWCERATGIGDEIIVQLPRETLKGCFETIDEKGHLILRTPSGIRKISGGDVFF